MARGALSDYTHHDTQKTLLLLLSVRKTDPENSNVPNMVRSLLQSGGGIANLSIKSLVQQEETDDPIESRNQARLETLRRACLKYPETSANSSDYCQRLEKDKICKFSHQTCLKGQLGEWLFTRRSQSLSREA